MKNDRAQMSLMWTQAKEILKCDFSEKQKKPLSYHKNNMILYTGFPEFFAGMYSFI